MLDSHADIDVKKCVIITISSNDILQKLHFEDLSILPRHENVVCRKRCNEQFECGHSCKKTCHFQTPNNHGICDVMVKKIVPGCGHEIHIECWQTPERSDCKKTSSTRLPCGHAVDVPCRIISSQSALENVFCPKSCAAMLSCQHQCVGKCGECRAGKLHAPCGQKCERELICSHVRG